MGKQYFKCVACETEVNADQDRMIGFECHDTHMDHHGSKVTVTEMLESGVHHSYDLRCKHCGCNYFYPKSYNHVSFTLDDEQEKVLHEAIQNHFTVRIEGVIDGDLCTVERLEVEEGN